MQNWYSPFWYRRFTESYANYTNTIESLTKVVLELFPKIISYYYMEEKQANNTRKTTRWKTSNSDNESKTRDITLSNDKTLLDILEDFLADNTKAKQLIGLLARQSIWENATENIDDNAPKNQMENLFQRCIRFIPSTINRTWN